MYIFNKITVNPQLPKRVGELLDIQNDDIKIKKLI